MSFVMPPRLRSEPWPALPDNKRELSENRQALNSFPRIPRSSPLILNAPFDKLDKPVLSGKQNRSNSATPQRELSGIPLTHPCSSVFICGVSKSRHAGAKTLGVRT
jgi:hypothetical protein